MYQLPNGLLCVASMTTLPLIVLLLMEPPDWESFETTLPSTSA
jgi:hypothetical protein